MSIKQELENAREKFRLLSLYQRFEHAVVLILTGLIAIIVVAAVWNLSVKMRSAVFCPEAWTRLTTVLSRRCSV
jgi:hypothetical protein